MRLEYMRVRVERERSAWADKERECRRQLAQLDARLDNVYQAVAQSGGRDGQQASLSQVCSQGCSGAETPQSQPKPPAQIIHLRAR